MIDFSKYNLQELRAIGEVMDDLTSKEVELESWQFACYFRSTAREAFRAESAAIDQQARDHAAAEAEKVDRIKQACVAGAPPAVNCCNIDRCGVCLTDCPYTDEPLPAEEPDELRDLRALVDTLSRCSDRLAALAHEEDEHFAESSQMNDFLKASSLRNANRSIIDLLADIRDHYDGLH